MNIGLSFPGCHRRGGVERVVFECARFLAERGHEVRVFAEQFEAQSGVGFTPVRARRLPFFLSGAQYFYRCSRSIKQADIEVLGTHGAVCPTNGVHWVQSVHAAWLERSAEMRGRFSVARLRQRLNPLHPILLELEKKHFKERAYRRVIATTPQVRSDLGRIYGVPESDVQIIPNGFSPEEFNPERRANRRLFMRESLGLKPDQRALLFAANELDRKGYGTILEALRLLRSPKIRVIVVGRPSPEAVLAQAARAGVAGSVIACGSTDRMADYHAAADIFVLPTQYEAFSLAILEALGSGLPVVTTNVPGARDAIVPGVNGLLQGEPKNGNELAEILRSLDGHALEALSAQASLSVRQFQWPNVLLQYEAVLRSVSEGGMAKKEPCVF
ncbi:MAG: glycosyltransferase family 1 protein [Verrucomicrobia bacterium]|nr:glycosyltransferase family 1 protein [Verrucomicrobiota bacterium]